MKMRYRIVKVPNHTGNPFRVQECAPWPLSWTIGWEFVEPSRWWASVDVAQADIDDRKARDGRGAVVVAAHVVSSKTDTSGAGNG